MTLGILSASNLTLPSDTDSQRVSGGGGHLKELHSHQMPGAVGIFCTGRSHQHQSPWLCLA